MATYKIAILVGSLREGQHQPEGRAVDLRFSGDRLDCTIVEIGDLPLYNQDYDAQSGAAI